MKKQKKIALCALLSSASVAVLFLGSVSGVLDMVSACIASAAVLFCALEFGIGYGFSVWAVVSVLSLTLLPEKTAAWTFALFFGLHILLVPLLEKLGKTLSFLLRLAFANLTLVFYLWVIEKVLSVPEEKWLNIAVFVSMNIIFCLCNVLYFRVIRLYYLVFRKKIEKLLK